MTTIRSYTTLKERMGLAALQPTPSWRVSDVAKYFGVARNTVYKWVYKGVLPVHRTPGGGMRFVEAEVKAAQLKREEA